MRRRALACGLAALAGALAAQPPIKEAADLLADQPDLARDLIHADLPLFDDRTAAKWPQSFTVDNSGFGCTSRVRFGDWVLDEQGEDLRPEDRQWFRIENYGAIHCWALLSTAMGRKALRGAEARDSFFVELGVADGRELWAIQMGAVPGSDYLLLSRAPGDGVVTEFMLLQSDCPEGSRRQGGPLDILITSYCAVNTAADLRALAARMARLPPVGRLRLVKPARAD